MIFSVWNGNGKAIIILMKKMSAFALFADSFLAAACAFMITFTAVRFYTKEGAASLICGAAAFILFGAAAFARLRRKRGKLVRSRAESAKKRALFEHLSGICPEAAAELLLPALGGKMAEGGIESGDKLYFLKFTPRPLSPNEVCREATFSTPLKKIILCGAAEEQTAEFCRRCGAELAQGDEAYEAIKTCPFDPPPKAPRTKGPKELLSRAFRRSSAGRWLRCGLWLTTFSYFTFFPAWYIAAGGTMLVLAALCLIFGKRD